MTHLRADSSGTHWLTDQSADLHPAKRHNGVGRPPAQSNWDMLASYGAGQPSNAKGQIMSSTKGKILVVEDEALIAMSIEFALQELGFETMVASNLEAAHAHLAMSDIRLAVLDYKLREERRQASPRPCARSVSRLSSVQDRSSTTSPRSSRARRS